MSEKSEVEIDLPDEEIFLLMKEAHRQDITFNQLIENILREAIEKHEQDNPEN